MTLRQRIERLVCRVLGHRWGRASLSDVFPSTFFLCRRCGHIWTNQGTP